jgi:Ribosome-associated heat shock protein implicated in the recycling of the 50S subunit (S4 paralog)
MSGVRLDKWLWAARFFKTRGLARDAIDGGKIRIDGVKAKPSKVVMPGLQIEISKGQMVMVVDVVDVREDRRPASEAALLYAETPDSIKAREAEADIRKFARQGFQPTDHRPNKRERRQLTKLKGIFDD